MLLTVLCSGSRTSYTLYHSSPYIYTLYHSPPYIYILYHSSPYIYTVHIGRQKHVTCTTLHKQCNPLSSNCLACALKTQPQTSQSPLSHTRALQAHTHARNTCCLSRPIVGSDGSCDLVSCVLLCSDSDLLRHTSRDLLSPHCSTHLAMQAQVLLFHFPPHTLALQADTHSRTFHLLPRAICSPPTAPLI